MRECDSHVVVIAEIGVNHNGSIEIAKQLIDVSARAGADYAKFQTFRASELVSSDAPLAEYQKRVVGPVKQQELLSSLEFSENQFNELREYCSQRNIGFLTTAHDLVSASYVIGLGLDFIKVASGDLTNYPLLRLVGSQGVPVLLSTGASHLREVGDAVSILESAGLDRSQIVILQCTSEYPAPRTEANLLAMVEMGRVWGVAFGYSDHTSGSEASLAAVALGATVVEKHITLDQTMPGPDHRASLTGEEFLDFVARIRIVEELRGIPDKVVTVSEKKNREVIRKSIVAATHISKGEILGDDNIRVSRPGTGLSPMYWPEIVGTRAHRDYVPGESIEIP